MTRIEMLSSYNPIPGFQGGTVRNTSVTKIEKKGHHIGHYFPRHFDPYKRPCLNDLQKEY